MTYARITNTNSFISNTSENDQDHYIVLSFQTALNMKNYDYAYSLFQQHLCIPESLKCKYELNNPTATLNNFIKLCDSFEKILLSYKLKMIKDVLHFNPILSVWYKGNTIAFEHPENRSNNPNNSLNLQIEHASMVCMIKGILQNNDSELIKEFLTKNVTLLNCFIHMSFDELVSVLSSARQIQGDQESQLIVCMLLCSITNYRALKHIVTECNLQNRNNLSIIDTVIRDRYFTLEKQIDEKIKPVRKEFFYDLSDVNNSSSFHSSSSTALIQKITVNHILPNNLIKIIQDRFPTIEKLKVFVGKNECISRIFSVSAEDAKIMQANFLFLEIIGIKISDDQNLQARYNLLNEVGIKIIDLKKYQNVLQQYQAISDSDTNYLQSKQPPAEIINRIQDNQINPEKYKVNDNLSASNNSSTVFQKFTQATRNDNGLPEKNSIYKRSAFM